MNPSSHKKKTAILLWGLCISLFSAGQSYTANMDITADLQPDPGAIEAISVRITNTSRSALVIGKSIFALYMEYDGSSNAGQTFNQMVKLPKTLQPGESYTFSRLSFKTPIYPGNYPVHVSFRWGNRVICEEAITFRVAGKYSASISARRLTLPDEPDTDLEFTVTNTGNTAWPEGRYGLRFELKSSPSAATNADKARFRITPREVETWDFEPGNSDQIVFRNFLLPRVTGSYVVIVRLLLDGNPFEAEGASREFTFKITH